MEVCYSAASGSLSIVPDQNPDRPTPGPEEPEPPCFLVFDGVGLTPDGLKDWLRLCAKQVGVLRVLLTPSLHREGNQSRLFLTFTEAGSENEKEPKYSFTPRTQQHPCESEDAGLKYLFIYLHTEHKGCFGLQGKTKQNKNESMEKNSNLFLFFKYQLQKTAEPKDGF